MLCSFLACWIPKAITREDEYVNTICRTNRCWQEFPRKRGCFGMGRLGLEYKLHAKIICLYLISSNDCYVQRWCVSVGGWRWLIREDCWMITVVILWTSIQIIMIEHWSKEMLSNNHPKMAIIFQSKFDWTIATRKQIWYHFPLIQFVLQKITTSLSIPSSLHRYLSSTRTSSMSSSSSSQERNVKQDLQQHQK